MARLIEMITLIRSNRNLRPGDLAEHFGISKKRIHDDVQDLCMAGVPLVFEGNGYRILEGFFLPPTAYSMEEAVTLILALHLLEKAGGYPDGVSTRALLSKALGALPGGENRAMIKVAEILLRETEGERSPVVKVVTEGMVEKRSLELVYYSLNQEKETVRAVDAYAVTYRKNAWYLIGLCHSRNEIRTFKLSRIRRIKKTDQTYQVPKGFSLDKYLADSWGIRSGPNKRVKIRFEPVIATLIQEKRFPNGRFVKEKNGSVILEATTSSTEEVRWWIMQYGASAEVLEPPELREAIRQEVEQMRQKYRQ
jgi:predicted DNA-binding transcriptional regulator YafY